MDDAGAKNQETRQGQRPARMVGHSSLDEALYGKDANTGLQFNATWQGRQG